jgi:hypothetical protein
VELVWLWIDEEPRKVLTVFVLGFGRGIVFLLCFLLYGTVMRLTGFYMLVRIPVVVSLPRSSDTVRPALPYTVPRDTELRRYL